MKRPRRRGRTVAQIEASKNNFRIRRLRAFQGSLQDLFNSSAASEINEMIEHRIKELKKDD